MATTFTAPEASTASTSPSSAYPLIADGYAGSVKGLLTKFTFSAAFALNDVVKMCRIPNRAQILAVKLWVDPLDSSTGVVVAVGDSTDDDRFISGATIGRSSAGGVTDTMVLATGVGFTYAGDDTINFKITTAATGTPTTSGTIALLVLYRMTV